MKITDNNLNKNIFLKISGNNELLSKQCNCSANSENIFSNELSNSLKELSLIDDEKLRENAIVNGKQVLENWATPSNTQIDLIFSSMKQTVM